MTTRAERQDFRVRRREWMAGVLATLSGCGGGVDSGGTGTGSADPTLAVGAITGFGSVIVNGIRFDDVAAGVSDDEGRVASSGALRLGMRVEITASAVVPGAGTPTAVASSIRVRSAVVGPVESVDAPAGRLVVLGQAVDTTATTAIEGGMAAIRVGDVVRVHGTLDVAGGRTVATRVESGAGAYRVRGALVGVDLAAGRATLGTATIDWSAVAPSDPAASLVPGRIVTVRLATAPVSGVWTAQALEVEASTPRADRQQAEIEGRITAWTSVTSFTVDDVPVDASAAAFPDGSAGVVLGAKVEVAGRLVSGVLVAGEVSIEDDEGSNDSFELHGAIETVDAPGRSFVVRGVTVRWSDTTTFDSSTADDIAAGRQVEVRGGLTPDGAAIDATLVHVEL